MLDYLAVDLVRHKYDLKHTLERICTSQVYQLSVVAPEPRVEAPRFRGPVARRLTAEQFVDAVWQITGEAPLRADVGVDRSDRLPQPAGAQPPRLAARWIWAYVEGASNRPRGGETITLRRVFRLDKPPARAVCAVTCDNHYELFCNGRRVHSNSDWTSIDLLDLAAQLKVGANTLMVTARNAGATPNPAGLLLELRCWDASAIQPPPAASSAGQENQQKPIAPAVVIGSDGQWQWTAARLTDRGRFSTPPKDWKAARPVAHPQVWQAATEELGARLSAASGGKWPMVRASLMKNTAFMRALGRPTRDQIVTMRPNELTTLEAIDLANEEGLYRAIGAGAARLCQKFPEGSDELARHVFRFAVSRDPTPRELELVNQLLEKTPRQEAVEDLIWSVLMLPEFQFVQ